MIKQFIVREDRDINAEQVNLSWASGQELAFVDDDGQAMQPLSEW
jgi:hypothetical protein